MKKYLIFFFLAGCGYSFKSLTTSQYQTIYVPVAQNEIKIEEPSPSYRLYYPGIEIELTKAVLDRIVYDGSLKPVSQENMADLILKMSLKRFDRQALGYSSSQEVEEFRLILEANVVVYDRKKEKKILKEDIIGDTTYFTTGSNAKSESQAIQDLVKDLARRIVDRVVEGW